MCFNSETEVFRKSEGNRIAQYTYKILSDVGEYYAVYNSNIDQFVTLPTSALAECARHTGDTYAEAKAEAERNVFDLSLTF